MSFPVIFARRNSHFDYVSDCINLCGNTIVVAVGTVCLATITKLALHIFAYYDPVAAAHASAKASAAIKASASFFTANPAISACADISQDKQVTWVSGSE